MIKAALIDLDGTILDSMGMWENLGEEVLHSLGFTSKENLNEKFKSLTVSQAAEYYSKNFPINLTVPEIETFIHKTIENSYKYQLPLKTGARNFLETLKDYEIKLALVTTTNSILARQALKRLEVLELFDLILSCDDLNCSKNDSTIYDLAVNKLKVNKKEVIIFEDALHAIKTAKENGYITVGIFDPYISEQKEIKEIADLYLKNFKNLDNLLNKFRRDNENSFNNCRK